jgi:hypothetical protein
MSSIWLIISVWLSGLGPQVTMQSASDLAACRKAAEATTQMLEQQARSNLIALHGGLKREQNTDKSETVLSTGVGREIARLRCIEAQSQPGNSRGGKL